MSDFTAIGQLVNEARNLLDSIKGGAIRTMQTQFDALKQTITTDGAKVVSDVDSLGRNKLQQLDSELARVKQSVDINALGGEARYVTEITVNGDKDTFYPVYFAMPSGETEIQIFRNYTWNNKGSSEPSDFDSATVAGVVVVLRGNSTPWSGNGAYLRTLVNVQTYRQTVANIGLNAFCHVEKYNPLGPDTPYNRPGDYYGHKQKSGFMLRGGKLKYQIITNKPIAFELKQDGELLINWTTDVANGTLTAKTLSASQVTTGDADNNHGYSYNGYKSSKVGA